jgi:tRNA (cmo5U34)-methyltransferase
MQFNEEMATEYDKGIRRTFPSYDAMFKLVQAYLRTNTEKDANLLIVGAGGGTELALLGPKNPDWIFTAIDPAEPMLDLARNKVDQLKMTDRVNFIEGTIDEVEDGKLYDAATFLLVLHFIADNDEKLRQLKSIRQRLKPGAPFVLASMYGDLNDPAINALFSLWKAYWLDSTNLSEAEVDEMELSVRSLSFISEDEIELLLRGAGFGSIAKFFQTNIFGGWICKAE